MKLQSKVVWEEGMHLAPHHFQAQSRYFEESVHFATSGLWKYSYGLADYQLDPDALRNGTVDLRSARGVFEDGLSFDIPECDPKPSAINIADKFGVGSDSVRIDMAVPRWTANGQNCSIEGESEQTARYIGTLQPLPDENTGRDDKPIRLGRKNIQLILGSEATDDLLTLPLARVARDGSGKYVYDPSFVPPLVRIGSSESLAAMLRRIVEVLEEKSTMASRQQHQSAGRFQAGMSARDVAQFWFLHAVNSSLSPLRHLLLSKHGHPEELFSEMSRLAGALCTFDLETHPSSLPAYNHRDPGPCFQRLDADILRLLEVVVPSQAVVIPLRPAERYFFNGEVKDERCLGRCRWILGIHSPIGEADLIAKAGQLVKVCSAQFVPELVKRALPGLTLTHMQVPPSAVAAKVDSQYFAISRNGPCWDHIVKTKRVGLYVPGDFPSPELDFIVLLES
jgi:type VI secretion system protein ImpJ